MSNFDYNALAKEIMREPGFYENLALAVEKHREEKAREERIAEKKMLASLHYFDHIDNICIRCGEKFWATATETNLNAKCPKAKAQEGT